MTTQTHSFAWAEPELRAPFAHEIKAPSPSILGADGRPAGTGGEDARALALRPALALLQAVQAGLRAGAAVVLRQQMAERARAAGVT